MKFTEELFYGEVKKKCIILMMIMVVFIAVIFSFIVYYDNQKINTINLNEIESKNSEAITYYLDDVKVEKKFSTIQGWAIEVGEDIKTVECYVVLKKEGSNEYFKLNTVKVDRADLNSAFNDGHSYENGGFFAKVLNRKLEKDCNYEIYILYKNNNKNYFVNTQNKLFLGEE